MNERMTVEWIKRNGIVLCKVNGFVVAQGQCVCQDAAHKLGQEWYSALGYFWDGRVSIQ